MLSKVLVGAAAAVMAIGGLSACSSSSNSSAESASPSVTPSISISASPSATGESIVALDKEIQTDLNAVGCYAGAVDGILGPETDQAIVKFQTADGLTVDGEAGPATIAALKKAVKEGRIVCTATASPTATPTASPTSTGGACTAAALQASLPSGAKLQSFTCANVGGTRWAAGQYMTGPEVANFFAKSEGGSWTSVSADEICGTASAGLPQKILDYCGLT